jgi:hypothetical protein
MIIILPKHVCYRTPSSYAVADAYPSPHVYPAANAHVPQPQILFTYSVKINNLKLATSSNVHLDGELGGNGNETHHIVVSTTLQNTRGQAKVVSGFLLDTSTDGTFK